MRTRVVFLLCDYPPFPETRVRFVAGYFGSSPDENGMFDPVASSTDRSFRRCPRRGLDVVDG
jgi:hypothetical protein